MALYNVHVFREMRLLFAGIEAATPEDAAKIAADLQASSAKSVDDCDGQNHAAIVDVIGDNDFSQSRTINF